MKILYKFLILLSGVFGLAIGFTIIDGFNIPLTAKAIFMIIIVAVEISLTYFIFLKDDEVKGCGKDLNMQYPEGRSKCGGECFGCTEIHYCKECIKEEGEKK